MASKIADLVVNFVSTGWQQVMQRVGQIQMRVAAIRAQLGHGINITAGWGAGILALAAASSRGSVEASQFAYASELLGNTLGNILVPIVRLMTVGLEMLNMAMQRLSPSGQTIIIVFAAIAIATMSATVAFKAASPVLGVMIGLFLSLSRALLAAAVAMLRMVAATVVWMVATPQGRAAALIAGIVGAVGAASGAFDEIGKVIKDKMAWINKQLESMFTGAKIKLPGINIDFDKLPNIPEFFKRIMEIFEQSKGPMRVRLDVVFEHGPWQSWERIQKALLEQSRDDPRQDQQLNKLKDMLNGLFGKLSEDVRGAINNKHLGLA